MADAIHLWAFNSWTVSARSQRLQNREINMITMTSVQIRNIRCHEIIIIIVNSHPQVKWIRYRFVRWRIWWEFMIRNTKILTFSEWFIWWMEHETICKYNTDACQTRVVCSRTHTHPCMLYAMTPVIFLIFRSTHANGMNSSFVCFQELWHERQNKQMAMPLESYWWIA